MYVLMNIKRLFDGTSSNNKSYREKVDIAIDDGRIDMIVPSGVRRWESGAEIVDCSSYEVAPGLIDCHSHLTILGATESDVNIINSAEGMLYIEKILYTTLVEGGVTSVRDMGGATHSLKCLVERGVVIGPRLFISICMLSATGGHADFRGYDRCHDTVSRVFPPGPGRPSSIVDGPWDCRRRVREIAACGADFIKVCTSPGVISNSQDLSRRDFTVEEITAICDEAANKGLRVAAHAHSRVGIEVAIESGVRDLQHVSFLDAELCHKARDAACTVTPTSWIIQSATGVTSLPAAIAAKGRIVAETHSSAVMHARAAGIPILAGTDPIMRGMHGKNYLELQSLMQDGLTAREAWHAATGLPAQELSMGDIGTVEQGRRADLLVCQEGCLDQPAKLKDGLVEVIKDGYGHRGALSGIPQATFRSKAATLLSPLRESAASA